MSADKYLSIFSRQMATIVYIVSRQTEATVSMSFEANSNVYSVL